MYSLRFPKMDCKDMTLQQIRGLEGIRVRKAYQTAAKLNGIPWRKRAYKANEWEASDNINRTLSAAGSKAGGFCR